MRGLSSALSPSEGDGLGGFVCFPSCGHEATWSHGATEKQSLGSDQVVHAQSKRWLWTGVSVHATRMLSWKVMRRGHGKIEAAV